MFINAEIRVRDITLHLVIWLMLTILTLGLAFFVYPYAFAKFIIDRSSIVQPDGSEKPLYCDVDIFSNIGHAVVWLVITIITLGLGYFFYFYRVWNYSLNNTKILPSSGT
ncbi:hypothetical protein CS022_05360 [Veronia nyctiphanis]|uniref:Uncharacterized protein n=1 Tax=Veronia nyctiphanis TaxID=1278244 RepID=A0A4Q0YS85_9GAMM|nr:DUF6693 family protein [Veronia nyctiphanis]RXJ74070.1 hypothetical protein CS022_05360 [Veronia nyctiphanis]